MTLTINEQQEMVQASRTGCPVDHRAFGQQKTLRATSAAGPAIARDEQGIWRVRGPAEARAILRSTATKQAGFSAETIDIATATIERPILYQEGAKHHEQRRQTARFFTPKFTGEHYRALMESLSDKVIAELRQKGTADLSALSLNMAVNVAARVIGLTNSLLPGMDRRLDAFFTDAVPKKQSLRATWRSLRNHAHLLAFFLIDVKPAIAARRKQPGQDVISHLIKSGYNDLSILTECITYGAAGMVTTREFISVAAWHFLEQPELRQRFLQADEAERQAMLQEILRVEPVVGVLHRRTTEDLTIESDGQQVTIPANEHIAIEVYDVNADEPLVGQPTRAICPGRELSDERVGPAVMSFGDGHHRCPGAYVALQESDIFLQKLLAINSLRIVHAPTLGHNAVAEGYELRKFIVAVS